MSYKKTSPEIIDELVELFLDVPATEIEVSIPTGRYKEGIAPPISEERAKEEYAEIRKRFDKLLSLTKDFDSGKDNYWVLWLFEKLEEKALLQIREFSGLAQTTDPERVKEQCSYLPDTVVENKKLSLKYEGSIQRSKAGKGNKNQEAFSIVEEWYNKFLKNKKLYKNKTAFVEAMINETGLSRSSIYKYLREIKKK